MADDRSRVLVTFAPPPGFDAAVSEVLGPLADLTYLTQVGDDARGDALSGADAVLGLHLGRELRDGGEFAQLRSAGFVQLLSAGADTVPFEQIPAGVTLASNAGAYAEPMAEHVLAMVLALLKRLPQNQAAMARGEFDPETPTGSLRSATVGILGFGGIGRACARLLASLGATIHGLARSRRPPEPPADWIGGMDDLDALLAGADVLVISLPLSRATRGLIGARELALMNPRATLINVARGAILDEDALYDHLRANPEFSAGLDVWWDEPADGEPFAPRHPFLELPNVVASPHNSGSVEGALEAGARRAAENVARYLRGESAHHVVDRAEYTTA